MENVIIQRIITSTGNVGILTKLDENVFEFTRQVGKRLIRTIKNAKHCSLFEEKLSGRVQILSFK